MKLCTVEDDAEAILAASETNKWTVVCENEGEQFTTTCEYLALATGHHAKPKEPRFPGEENFKGMVYNGVWCIVHFLIWYTQTRPCDGTMCSWTRSSV